MKKTNHVDDTSPRESTGIVSQVIVADVASRTIKSSLTLGENLSDLDLEVLDLLLVASDEEDKQQALSSQNQ